MREHGARVLTFTTGQAQSGARLVGGPVRLCGWSANGGAGTTDTPVTGNVTAPAAGATISSVSLGNGTYTVEWTIELTGTPGAGDVDNVQLLIGATVVADSSNLGVVGDYPQANADINVTGGPLVLAAKAIGAGTAGATYKVTMTVIPTSSSTATILDGGQAVGYINVGPTGSQTVWFDHGGVAVQTELDVLATAGTVSGVLYYDMLYGDDWDNEYKSDKP
jgi:hypothetical protein